MENSIRIEKVNPYPANILSWKCRMFVTSAAYTQMHFKNIFIMEANTMNPDQTAPKGAVWSGSIVFAL